MQVSLERVFLKHNLFISIAFFLFMDISYKEKQIKNIQQGDSFIAISGVIVSKEGNSFIVDDGTGSIGIFFDALNVEEGSYVRVFGRLSGFEHGVEMQAEFIQDLHD